MDMDRLEHIFKLQEKFDTALMENRKLHDISREEWIQKETLAIISELAELLNEVNFKWWKNPQELNEAAIREELVDILHFFVSMCLKMNMTAEDLYQGYLRKNEENFKRQQGRSDKKGYEWK